MTTLSLLSYAKVDLQCHKLDRPIFTSAQMTETGHKFNNSLDKLWHKAVESI